jgi:hypothetical protein
MIPRQLQLIADVATDGDLCDRGNPKGLEHLITEENPEPGLRDKRRGKALSRLLLGMDEGSQPFLVPAECPLRPVW